MNTYIIYRKKNKVTKVTPTGTVNRHIMGEEVVIMEFTLVSPITFQIGDYVDVYGERYWLNVPGTDQKISEREYRYNLRFESVKYELAKIQLLFPDEFNQLRIPDFSVVGNAQTIIDLIVRNANRAMRSLSGFVRPVNQVHRNSIGVAWRAGIVEHTSAQNHTFSTNNLLQALSKLAETYELEFYVDYDRSIHLKKRKIPTDISFKYGERKGLRSLTRAPYDNSNIVTRLYAFGADKNIPANYGGTRLRMPVYYLEANSAKYGIIEHTILFDEIYPHREGEVSTVFADDFLSFIDAGIDFDLNAADESGNTLYLIAGVSAKVTFNTGQLAGYTFDIRENGFDSATNKIILKQNEDEALNVPNDLMRPAVGDKYVITDIRMPESYVRTAERLVQQKAQEYLTENCNPRFQYTCVADPLYFELEGRNIDVGHEITIADDDLQVNKPIRVIGWKKSLQNPFEVEFVLSDVVTQSAIVRSYMQQDRLNALVYAFQNFNAFSQRQNWRVNQELLEMIFDGEGYFDMDRIRPLSIETKMLSVGSRLQQFAMPGVVLQVSEDLTTVHNTAGELVHLTILDDGVRTWILNEQISPALDEDFYYIYARCQREGTGAYVFLSHDQIAVDFDDEYYHFEIGALSSVDEGFRRIKTTYGFTTINGGEITTGKILQQSTGELFIDIDNRKIIGDIEFLPNSTAYQQLLNNLGNPRANLFKNGRTPIVASNPSDPFNLLIGRNTDLQAFYEQCAEGEIFTFSAKVSSGTISSFKFADQEGRNLVDSFMIIKDGTDGNVEVSFVVNNSVISNQIVQVIGNTLGLSYVKIEKGVPATAWVVSLEEYNEQAEMVQAVADRTDFLNATLIAGNVVATGTLLVGNENGANAGVTGIGTGNDALRFYAGAEPADMATAPFRVTDAGKVMARVCEIGDGVFAFVTTPEGLHTESGKIELANTGVQGDQGVVRITSPNYSQDRPVFYILDYDQNNRPYSAYINGSGTPSSIALRTDGSIVINGNIKYTGTLERITL